MAIYNNDQDPNVKMWETHQAKESKAKRPKIQVLSPDGGHDKSANSTPKRKIVNYLISNCYEKNCQL